MKEEIKKKWLKALRSKTYRQNVGELKCYDRFCCLGVLTDLYIKEHPKSSWENYENRINLPEKVQRWAGLYGEEPKVAFNKKLLNRIGKDFIEERETTDKPKKICLSTLNDGGLSFTEIADIIARNL